MKHHLENNVLTLFLPKDVSHSLVNSLQIVEYNCEELVLDFEKTGFITLPGAMYLIMLSSYLSKNNNGRFRKCEIVNMDDRLIDVLIQFSFFEIMVNYSKLQVNAEIIKIEAKARKYEYLYR